MIPANLPGDSIRIRGLDINCHIGVGEEERAAPQALRLDLDLYPDGGLHGLDDDLRRTVDYHAVCLAVRDLAAARPRALVESLGEEILALLESSFGVRRAVVTVHKFILPFTESVGIRIHSRDFHARIPPAGGAWQGDE